MIEYTTMTLVMIVCGIALVLAILISLVRRSRSPHSNIDIDDLLIGEDGRLSKAAAVMMGSFAATTWMMVHLVLAGKMTEGFFAAYLAAWVAPTVTKLIVNRPSTGVDTTETTTRSKSTVHVGD